MNLISAGNEDVVGVVLAGGRAQRMGGGKALRPLGGEPMIAHVIERLRRQVGALVINANDDPATFAAFGLPVAADVYGDYAGPLAGVLTGMCWAREHAPDARYIATAPCDTPFLPEDFVETLRRATGGAGAAIAIAASASGRHYVLGLWDIALADDLAAYLDGGGRKVRDWVERHPHTVVEFAAAGPSGADLLYNVNTPEEFATAEQLLRGGTT